MKKLSNLFLGFITFVFVAVVGLVLCYFAFPNFKNYVDNLFNPTTLSFSLKLYTEENVGEGYNEAWQGYAYFELGEYPQSLKSDNVKVTPNDNVETLSTGLLGTGDDGARYYYQSRVGYGVSGWYKFEPIRWLVLATSVDLTDASVYGLGANNHADMPQNGKQVLALSEFVLYDDYFDKDTPSVNEFGNKNCDLSNNLNTIFAETSGLSEYFGRCIVNTTLGTTYGITNEDGSVSEGFSENACNLFTLSFSNGKDENDDAFRFLNYMETKSEQAQAVPTEFAHATGCSLDTLNNSTVWWLRSGNHSSSTLAFAVGFEGYVSIGAVTETFGVRPNFVLNLS